MDRMESDVGSQGTFIMFYAKLYIYLIWIVLCLISLINFHFISFSFRSFIENPKDWSDHALWWPSKNTWLLRTRSTLDQCGVHADTILHFTPMHKILRVQVSKRIVWIRNSLFFSTCIWFFVGKADDAWNILPTDTHFY